MKKFLSLACFNALFTVTMFGQTQYNASTYHQFNTDYGYIQVGAQNSSWAHIYSDRSNFIFNKPVYSTNGFLSYNSNLNLEAASGYYVQIQPRSSSYGLILREYNSSDYGNIEVTSDGLGLGYNTSGYDLLIKTDGDVLIRDDMFFNMGNVFGFGYGQGNNRFTIHHTGTHGYIDYKDNLHFRADLNWISPLILQGDGNVAIGYGTTYSTDGTQYQTHGYKLGVNGDVYLENGWLRVSGQHGIYFQDYGGGFYMTDDTWIRTYNNKNFYHNSGIMRTDGTFQVGSNGNRFIVSSSGNVGIGQIQPIAKLQVQGSAGAGQSVCLDNRELKFRGDGVAHYSIFANRQGNLLTIENTSSSYAMNTPGNILLAINPNGGVGINTSVTTGSFQLYVNGGIVGEEVYVMEDVPASDYVFEKDYGLMPLNLLEGYIARNKHLPEVPSATQFKENGYSLGKMDDILLRKVEELTLYIIEQNKKIKELQEQVEILSNNQ